MTKYAVCRRDGPRSVPVNAVRYEFMALAEYALIFNYPHDNDYHVAAVSDEPADRSLSPTQEDC